MDADDGRPAPWAVATTIERPFPENGDLAAAILEAITVHGRLPVIGGTPANAYPPGRYWSVFCALNARRDILWVAPLTAPETFANLDHTDKTAIAVMPTLALHLDYHEQLTHLTLVLRDAAQRLTGLADAGAIPFFLMDAQDVVRPVGVGLLGQGRQHVVVQGRRETTAEVVVIHDNGLSSVTSDSHNDFGRCTHWSWADIADIEATPTLLVVTLHTAPAPLRWHLGMRARALDAAELDTIARVHAEHCVVAASPEQRTFASDSERDAELEIVRAAIRTPADFDSARLITRYGLDFVIDVLHKLPRNLYFVGYARPIVERLIGQGESRRAREVAELAPPAARAGTFSPLVIEALARQAYDAALALIEDVEQARSDRPLPGHWLLWKVASLLALGRLSEARKARPDPRESEDPFLHLAAACVTEPPERDRSLACALRFGLESQGAEHGAWIEVLGLPRDHPVTMCLAQSQASRQHAAAIAASAVAVASTHPTVLGDTVAITERAPARPGRPSALQVRGCSKVELPVTDTYISNLAALRTVLAIRLGDGRLLLTRAEASGALTVHATLPGPFHAPGASALAMSDHTLVIADERRGLVVVGLDTHREVASIPPRRTRGFSGLAVHGDRIAAFDGIGLELFEGVGAPRTRDAVDLPATIGGATWHGHHVVVSSGAMLVSLDAEGSGVGDALRLTAETVDAGPVFSFGACVYAVVGNGVWRARVATDGTLRSEGWLPLPFALRPTRVDMRPCLHGVLVSDVAFERHVTLLAGPEEPFALLATQRLSTIADYFSATAWAGDLLVGGSGDHLYLIAVATR